MKRSPMPRRKTSMRRTGGRQRFPSPANEALLEGQRQVRARSGGRCEVALDCCTTWAAQVHHVVLRSAGGADTADNLLHVCMPCHNWIHANPDDARTRGLYGYAKLTQPSDEEDT